MRRLAALVACLLATAVAAWAIWSAGSSSTSHGASSAATVNQGPTPTASGAPGRTVTVSWVAGTLSNGHAVDGYLIRRYTTAGALQTTLAGCSGTIGATSCVESSVPDGSWRYGVTPVIATNWQGAEGPRSTAILVDTTPPTAGAQLTPAANGAGWNNSTPVAVALSASDGTGSGVNRITYTTDGSDPTTSGTAAVFTAALSISSNTTVRYFATDNAGNASSTQTQLVRIDSVAPANGVALSSVSGGALLSGSTVYYRGSAGGSLSLTNTLTDTGGSGAASSATAALGGTSTGFSHTPSLVSTPAGGPYVSNPFSWTAGASSSPSESLTGSDTAGNTATTTLSFVNDSVPASGGSVDATGLVGAGARYSQSQTLHVAFAKGTDGGSGLASSGSQLLRASATLSSAGTSDGACGTYGAYTQVGSNDPSSPVTDGVPGDNACYRYEYLVPDQVGNIASYTSGDIKVETTTPVSLTPSTAVLTAVTGTTSQLVSGSSVYYNPAQSGSFSVDSQASDVRSGVGQVAFASLGGFSGGGSVTTPNTGTTFRATYGWSANGASGSPGTQGLTATNNAGASATNASAFSVIKDATGPAGGSVDASGLVGASNRYSTSTALSIAFAKGTDGGSGLAATGAQLLRASATLSASGSSDGVCGTYGTYTQVGANDPASPKSDTVADHTCYRYAYVVSDVVGNQTTYTSPDIKVDTTAPAAPALAFSSLTSASATGTTVYYQPGASSGAFTVTATASDAFSGILSYAFATLPSGWTSTPGALGVEAYAYGAPNPTAPSGNQSVTTTNHAGLQSGSTAFTVVADSTAPSGGSVAYTTGYYTTASVSVSFTPGTDSGSGVNAASALLQRASTGLSGGTCGTTYTAFTTIASAPTSPFTDTLGTSGNCYVYRYQVSDAVGNQATYTSASVVKLDTQPPTQAFSLASPVSASLTGTTVFYNGAATGSFKLVDTVSDPASGAFSALFPGIATTGWTHASETPTTPSGGPFTSSTFSWTASPTNPAGYSVTGTDVAGNSGGGAITFASDTTAPTGSVTYSSAIYNTLSVPVTTSASDGGSGVNAGVIKRDQATLTTLTETCGTFANTFAATVTLVGGADTSVTSGHCYKYEYVVTDNVGNVATLTSANIASVDTTGPVLTGVVSQNAAGGTASGKLVVGEKLILTFNQALAAGSVPSTFSGTEDRAATLVNAVIAPDVTLTIGNFSLPGLDTGSPNYLGGGCIALCGVEQATFSGTVVLTNSGTSTTVALTLTSVGGSTSYASQGSLIFKPATSLTDGGNNPATGTVTTAGSFKLF